MLNARHEISLGKKKGPGARLQGRTSIAEAADRYSFIEIIPLANRRTPCAAAMAIGDRQVAYMALNLANLRELSEM